MALEVIGAGFGRTGTESMKKALELLGLGPCYHMYEVLPHPDRVALWRTAARGALPDWDAAFAGYCSTVDWPAAAFWRELAAHYPDARILLTVRDAEGWYRSMEKTILDVLRNSTDRDSIGISLIANGVFGGVIDDRRHIIDTYERNIAEVQAAFDDDRLLTYELGSGWEPLCRFFGRAVPDVPFPRSNSSDEFQNRFADVEGDSASGTE